MPGFAAPGRHLRLSEDGQGTLDHYLAGWDGRCPNHINESNLPLQIPDRQRNRLLHFTLMPFTA